MIVAEASATDTSSRQWRDFYRCACAWNGSLLTWTDNFGQLGDAELPPPTAPTVPRRSTVPTASPTGPAKTVTMSAQTLFAINGYTVLPEARVKIETGARRWPAPESPTSSATPTTYPCRDGRTLPTNHPWPARKPLPTFSTLTSRTRQRYTSKAAEKLARWHSTPPQLGTSTGELRSTSTASLSWLEMPR